MRHILWPLQKKRATILAHESELEIRLLIWIISFAAAAMFPRHSELPGVADTGINTYIQEFMSETNWMTWLGVVASSLLFMCTPLFTVGRPVPAWFLSQRTLDRHAAKLASHPFYLLRQSMFIIKMVAGFCWGAHPNIRAHFHMDPYPSDPGTWRNT